MNKTLAAASLTALLATAAAAETNSTDQQITADDCFIDLTTYAAAELPKGVTLKLGDFHIKQFIEDCEATTQSEASPSIENLEEVRIHGQGAVEFSPPL